jgi:hypothetical protein
MFHNHIDIPVRILRGEVPPPPTEAVRFYDYERVGRDFVSDDFLDWLESKGFYPRAWSNLILFYAHPHAKTVVHTDNGPPNIWALNCLLTPGDIEIRWHTALGGTAQTEDLRYVRFDDSSPIIESTKMTNTLCRIGVPHSSINNTDQGAWFLSYRCMPTNLPWETTCQKFSGDPKLL